MTSRSVLPNESQIDVVVSVRNRESTITRSLGGVLNQSMDDLRLIVVDNGSEDSTASIVEAIDDSRVTLVLKENQGPGAARNLGTRAGSSPWIALLDSDDEPHRDWALALSSDGNDVGLVSCVGDRTRSGQFNNKA